jgi:cell wall assembly regulator SMI1
MASDESYDQLLDRLEGLTVEDEDGQLRLFVGLPGVSDEEIAAWEAKTRYAFPVDCKRFYRRWDGGGVASFEICPHGTWAMVESGLFVIHAWGNGDIDCIDLNPGRDGAIVFLGREDGRRMTVAPNFSSWLVRAVEEMQIHGALMHPFLDQKKGFYAKAASRLISKTVIRMQEPGDWTYRFCLALFKVRHGKLIWKHKSGRKQREAVYRFGKLRRETSWHENGAKSSETLYLNESVAHGAQKSWHPNGTLKSVRFFVQGYLQGKESTWDAEGRLICDRIWEWSKPVSETCFNWFTNAIEEKIYGDCDGERKILEVRRRPMSDQAPKPP